MATVSDAPTPMPQVGETWTDHAGRPVTLLLAHNGWGCWDLHDDESPWVCSLLVAIEHWTPPEPPIEWERWIGRDGGYSTLPWTEVAWRIVKREGQEPTIERVEP